MKQAYNPFLPLNVYIPDGEPHVFGDRVYLYGSHDGENADTFCVDDYEIFSAPVDDLTNWTSKGINYRTKQDPLSETTKRPYMYAPDCVRGNDGRYYLYYSLSGDKGNGGYFGPISVAVCDTPDGQFEFLGHLQNPDGSIFREFVMFDPAVINDDGVIRFYYGTYYPFSNLPKIVRGTMRKRESEMFNIPPEVIKAEGDDIMGPCTVTLCDDMITVSGHAKRILPVHDKKSGFKTWLSVTKKDGHNLCGHGFFEGSSIRKIDDTYYFIYSSAYNHELCYATSKYPDRDFTFGGTIVSNGDVGFAGRREKDRLNFTATTHGSIEKINGQWYVFYHRQTHGSDYSRQACAEKITILPDGSIPQVSITSCGLNAGDLSGIGKYPAAICCNLTNGHMPHGSNGRTTGIPMIFSGAGKGKTANSSEAKSYNEEAHNKTSHNEASHNEESKGAVLDPNIYPECGNLYIKDMTAGTRAVYKYFDLSKTKSVTVTARGQGILRVEAAFVRTDLAEAEATEGISSKYESGDTNAENNKSESLKPENVKPENIKPESIKSENCDSVVVDSSEWTEYKRDLVPEKNAVEGHYALCFRCIKGKLDLLEFELGD